MSVWKGSDATFRRIWSKNSRVAYLVVVAVLLIFLLYVRKKLVMAEYSLREVARQEMADNFSQSLYDTFLPSFALAQEKQNGGSRLLERQLTEMIPLYGFVMEQYESDLLLQVEKEEACRLTDEETIPEPENGLQDEKIQAMLAENQAIMQRENQVTEQGENQATVQGEMESSGSAEAVPYEQVFVPHTLQNQVDLVSLNDYETLVRDFYTIDKNTMAGSDQLNLADLLGQDCSISKDGEGPQILIYHTHSQEAFVDSIPGDTATTIVGVGEQLTKILQETYGYEVLHHTGQYDVEDRDNAYSKSLPAIEQVLQENSSIQVIIDLHRDQMAEETKLVMDLDGRPTARFMFFNGLSRTRKTGNISYLHNEHQEANLAFSFQMQLKAAEYYPGLTRKIYLKGYRYNMHLRPRTLLVELGAQNNTLEEAMNACDPLAHILDMVLSGQ